MKRKNKRGGEENAFKVTKTVIVFKESNVDKSWFLN
jgi:hypothetical protein